MNYSVKQLAELAGVTVRTLHHYDQIGLLKPEKVKVNGYRQYGKKELLRLQQILFFRELDFSLEEIMQMIDAPDFDVKSSLHHQKRLLELKSKRLNGLIKTINNTIENMDNNTHPDDKDLYDAFADDDVKEYQEEVKRRWGNSDAYRQSQERVGKMTKADMEKIKRDGEALAKEIAANISKGPEHPDVQVLIGQHYNALRTFYEPTLEMYEGLARMYVEDGRFAAYYNKYHPGLAQFMCDAMLAYVKAR